MPSRPTGEGRPSGPSSQICRNRRAFQAPYRIRVFFGDIRPGRRSHRKRPDSPSDSRVPITCNLNRFKALWRGILRYRPQFDAHLDRRVILSGRDEHILFPVEHSHERPHDLTDRTASLFIVIILDQHILAGHFVRYEGSNAGSNPDPAGPPGSRPTRTMQSKKSRRSLHTLHPPGREHRA